MRPTGKNLSIIINELNVSYHDEGPDDAPVIIFIHGFPLNKNTWNLQLDALKSTYRVIAYDIRGHGDSDSGPNDFSINLFANDLNLFLDTLQIEKAVICGLSMGGYIALTAVSRPKHRFQGLILADTQCIADTPEGKEKRKKSIESIHAYGVAQYADESIKHFFAAETYKSKKEVVAEIRDMIMKTTRTSISNTLHALAERRDTCRYLVEFKIPVLFLVGEEDSMTPPSASQFMKSKILKSTLRIIEKAGHLSNIENPESFNQHIRTFMEKIFSPVEVE